jgi:hypothetical protein
VQTPKEIQIYDSPSIIGSIIDGSFFDLDWEGIWKQLQNVKILLFIIVGLLTFSLLIFLVAKGRVYQKISNKILRALFIFSLVGGPSVTAFGPIVANRLFGDLLTCSFSPVVNTYSFSPLISINIWSLDDILTSRYDAYKTVENQPLASVFSPHQCSRKELTDSQSSSLSSPAVSHFSRFSTAPHFAQFSSPFRLITLFWLLLLVTLLLIKRISFSRRKMSLTPRHSEPVFIVPLPVFWFLDGEEDSPAWRLEATRAIRRIERGGGMFTTNHLGSGDLSVSPLGWGDARNGSVGQECYTKHGKKVTVADHFLQAHGLKLRYPLLPCLVSSQPKGPGGAIFPLELVSINASWNIFVAEHRKIHDGVASIPLLSYIPLPVPPFRPILPPPPPPPPSPLQPCAPQLEPSIKKATHSAFDPYIAGAERNKVYNKALSGKRSPKPKGCPTCERQKPLVVKFKPLSSTLLNVVLLVLLTGMSCGTVSTTFSDTTPSSAYLAPLSIHGRFPSNEIGLALTMGKIPSRYFRFSNSSFLSPVWNTLGNTHMFISACTLPQNTLKPIQLQRKISGQYFDDLLFGLMADDGQEEEEAAAAELTPPSDDGPSASILGSVNQPRAVPKPTPPKYTAPVKPPMVCTKPNKPVFTAPVKHIANPAKRRKPGDSVTLPPPSAKIPKVAPAPSVPPPIDAATIDLLIERALQQRLPSAAPQHLPSAAPQQRLFAEHRETSPHPLPTPSNTHLFNNRRVGSRNSGDPALEAHISRLAAKGHDFIRSILDAVRLLHGSSSR